MSHKNKNLSLKAKGLLSLMRSLLDDWNYNMHGLASLSRDGIDSVLSAIKELEGKGMNREIHVVKTRKSSAKASEKSL